MHPIKSRLFSLAGENMNLYVNLTSELCRFLVIDFGAVRRINDDGIFILARGLKSFSAETARIRGYLLALCKNDTNVFDKLCMSIYKDVMKEGVSGKTRVIREDNALALANALKAFEQKDDYLSIQSEWMHLSLNDLHRTLQSSCRINGLADALFAKPGVEFKRQAS